jgi:hypothetical protein
VATPDSSRKQRVLAAQGQRDQRRARLDDLEAELARELVGVGGGADLRDRRPAGGDDQRGGLGDLAVSCDRELPAFVRDLADDIAT